MSTTKKGELIRQINESGDPGALLAALEECRTNGWLEDGTLRGVYLENADLQRTRLQRADLQGAHLAGANLRAADLRDALLREADFSAADLSQTNLENADLTDTVLENTRLAGASLTEIQLARANSLADATMPDGSRYDGRFNLAGDLHNARQDKVYPDQAERMAEWYGIPLGQYQQGQTWAEANLEDVLEAAAVMEEAETRWLADARANGSLDDGSLRGEDLTEINLAGCDLSQARLPEVVLDDACLMRADLHEADLNRASLVGADLEGANLAEAVLRGADLTLADLTRANLRGADLRGADLSEASLDEADLQEANVADSQLAQVDTLTGATMPDGKRYNGRLNLEGDLYNAEDTGISPDNAEQMAVWYDVQLLDYQAGQEWARRNLPRLRPDDEEEE